MLCFYLTLSDVTHAAGPPPVITVQPSDVNVLYGGNAAFTVTATSGTTLSYQWYKNGLLILDVKLTGETASTLILSNVSSSDEGHYYVAVKNAGGTVYSRLAELAVVPNSAPVTTSDNYSTLEDVPLVISAPGVLANDTDGNSQTLTAVIATANQGSVSLNSNGAFTFTPPTNYFGNASFTYRASDGHLLLLEQNSSGANISEIKNGKQGSQSFKHGVAGGVGYMIKEIILYLSREATAGGDLIFSLGTNVNSGVVAGSAVAISSASISNTSSGVSFQTYKVGYSVPVGPFAAGTTYYLNFDNKSGNRVFVEYANANTYANGTYYDEGVNQSKDMRFQIYETIMSNPATVTINVIPVNDPPTAINDATNTLEDTSVSINVLANDGDVEGAALTITSASSTNGSAVVSGTNLIFTASPNFNGVAVVNYTISDGNSVSSARVIVTVAPVNDVPVGNNDFYTISEDVTLPVSGAGVLANDSDADGDTLSARLISDVSQGTLTLGADGRFTYRPTTNFYGIDTFSYSPTDGGSTGAVTIVTINVTPVNDGPPTPNNDAFATQEDVQLAQSAPGIFLNDVDVDGDGLNAKLVSNVSYGSLNFSVDGSFIYTPNPNFYGTDSFTYCLIDGAAELLQQSVSGGDKREVRDDEPGAQSFKHGNTGGYSYSISEVILRLSRKADSPNANLNFSIGTGINSGAIPGSNFTITRASITNVSGGSSFQDCLVAFASPVGPLIAGKTYYLNFNYESGGKELFIESSLSGNTYANGTYYKIGNDEGKDVRFQIQGVTQSDLATVTINVTSENDSPVARDDAYTTLENESLSIPGQSVLTNDFDVEGDMLTAIMVQGPTHGTLTLDAAGSFNYTPARGYAGDDFFTYRVSDGAATSSVANVAITVVAVPPLNLTSGAVVPGGFQFSLSGTPHSTCVIEVSTDLINWTPIATNSGSANSVTFTDPNADGSNQRFYRAVGR